MENWEATFAMMSVTVLNTNHLINLSLCQNFPAQPFICIDMLNASEYKLVVRDLKGDSRMKLWGVILKVI